MRAKVTTIAAAAAALVALVPPFRHAMPLAVASVAMTTPPPPDAGRLRLAVEKLGVVGSALFVAAHPDDENTTLLAHLGNQRLARTAYLSVTRGDGGQNLIGSEQGLDLGVIRTQELLAARRIDGAEQFFTRARDFGYSKSPEETLRLWGKDAILRDIVWVIRRFRPDIVIARFPAQHTEGQHGHHTASAILAGEAFRLAGDARFAAEQLALVRPWQPRRLLLNRSSFGARPTDDLSRFIKLDTGGYSALLGMSFGELAARSRSMHKSQGFGTAWRRGPTVDHFQVIDGEPLAIPSGGADLTKTDLFAGIDTTWRRFPGGDTVAMALGRALRELRADAPHLAIPALLDADVALAALPECDGWRDHARAALAEVVAGCAGLWLEATAADPATAPGDAVEIMARAINRSPAALSLESVRLSGGDPPGALASPVVATPKIALPANQPAEIKQTVAIAAGAPPTTPYWLESPPQPDAGVYSTPHPGLAGEAEGPPALVADFVVSRGTHRLTFRRSVVYKWSDPVAGERERPFLIAPRVSVAPEHALLVFAGAGPKTVRVRVGSSAARPVAGTARLAMESGWVAAPAAAPFSLAGRGDEVELAFSITPPPGRGDRKAYARVLAEVAPSPSGITPAATLPTKTGAGAAAPPADVFTHAVRHIEHAHLPVQTYLAEAKIELVRLQFEPGFRRIGYVPGAGDEVAAALAQAGYEVTVLDDEALASAPLDRFDAVVLGVRAVNTRARLRFSHPRLMTYVERGGTLVAQYNTNNRLARVEVPIGPYPFEIGRGRVTSQAAPVTFTAPDHPVLQAPNRITAADFEGWVQERGLYFASTWDPRYEAPLEMNDPGDKPQRGSLLVARHGKGRFVYTGLAFFRQLPAGVPGAFRLFANIIASSGSAASGTSGTKGRRGGSAR